MKSILRATLGGVRLWKNIQGHRYFTERLGLRLFVGPMAMNQWLLRPPLPVSRYEAPLFSVM